MNSQDFMKKNSIEQGLCGRNQPRCNDKPQGQFYSGLL